MDLTDNSTAVIRIRDNFYDFMSGCTKESTAKRLKFDNDSLCGSSICDIGQDKAVSHGEAIAAKAEVTRLQSQLQSLETQQQETKLQHEKEMEKLIHEHQKEIAKQSDIKNQLLVFAKKDSERKREILELKQELEKGKESKKMLVTVQRDKIVLEADLEQTKQEMAEAVGRMETEKESLKRSLQVMQKQLKDQEQLQMVLRTGGERNSILEQETENFRSQLSSANMRIKELEMTVSRFEEDGKVVQMMKSQISQLKQFEKENKALTEENQYLSAIQKNTHLLTETNNDLRSKLEHVQQQCVKLSKFEVLCEDLKKRLVQWESIDENSCLKSPSQIRQHTAELQRSLTQLLEKNGQLQATNHLLEETNSASLAQLQKAKAELATTSAKLKESDGLVLRLQKKLIFVSKEKELFKNIVDEYSHHDDDITSRVDARSNTRIEHLEKLIETHQKHVATLESDMKQIAQEKGQLRMRVTLLEQQLHSKGMDKEPVAIATTNVADQNIILGLRQKVEELEKKTEELTEQKEEALAQLERVDLQGGYDRSKTRVFHLRMNPYSMTRDRQTQEIDRLREENSRLSAKLNLMKESGGPVEGLSVIVDENLCPPGTAKELEEVKGQLTSEQLKNQRLMEAFKKTSQEMRDINYKVLGYRIDIPNTDEYRLMSMYAESPNDFFIFKQSSTDELQLMANQYSESFQKNIETYLTMGNSLPAFMSSVTLELHSRSTLMQS